MSVQKKKNDEKSDFLNAVLFQAIADQVNDMIIISELHGKIIFANQSASNVYGYSSDEFCKLQIHNLHISEKWDELDSQIVEACEHEVFYCTESLKKNGDSFLIEIRFKQICLAQKKLLISTVRDITETKMIEVALKSTERRYYAKLVGSLKKEIKERKTVEEMLRSSEEKFAAAFYMSPDAIIISQLDSTYVDVNEGFVQMSGYSQTETLGRAARELDIWVDHHAREQMIWRIKNHGEVNNLDTRFRRKNGSVLDGLLSARKVDMLGEPCVISVVRNITERKKIEEQLKQSEKRFRKVLTSLPVAIAYSDRAGNFKFTNDQFIELFGFSEEEVPTMDVWFETLYPEKSIREKYKEQFFSAVKKNMEEDSVKSILGVISYVRKDGTKKKIEAETIWDGEHLCAVFTDITEKRQTEELLRNSEKKYRTIFEAANDGIILRDLKTGKILDANEKACELYDYTLTEMLSGEMDIFRDCVPPCSINEIRERFISAVKGETQLFEWQIKQKNGICKWLEISWKRAAMGEEEFILAVARDISERKQSEFELCKSQTNNQALINAIPDSMIMIDTNGIIITYQYGRESGYSLVDEAYILTDEALNKSVFDVLPLEIANKMMKTVKAVIETGKIQIAEYMTSENGKTQYYETRSVASGANRVLTIRRNITERKEMEKKLKYLSLHDVLTGLYNRAYFEEYIKTMQAKTHNAVGMIVCDVDGLKVINDTLGHGVGDIILKEVAKILTTLFSDKDLIARIGGDEFVIFFSESSAKELNDCCNRLKEQVERYNTENPTIPISLSMGYAVNSQATVVDVDDLYKEADNNMYREKLHREKSTKSAIVQGLIKALEARDFITEGHSDRLQSLIQSFADVIGVPDSSIADLRLFAHFHDIGKVGISDSILFKPGRLTEEEWTEMRRHSEIGYRIAIATPDLTPIADWILKHHEWWDGTGYPLGIKGEDIPLPCRILSILDAYDAMTSERPYSNSKSHEAAAAELRRCAGTQFDPELVEKFLKMKIA